MKYFFSFLLTICLHSVNAQNNNCLSFTPKFKYKPLELNKIYVFQNDTLTITNFKFYVSNLQYFKNDSLVYTSTKKVHLLDVSKEQSLRINEKKSFNFDKIKFNIGIDSLTNVSGVFDDDLDPVNGMYWTWQSGYINFKLEGIATHCPTRNQKFNWHIGGYLNPFYTMREVSLNCQSSSFFEIFIQLDELLEEINVSKIYQVMSPSEKAVQIADVLPKIFNIK